MLYVVLTRAEKRRAYECHSRTDAIISMVDAHREIERGAFDFMGSTSAKAAETARRMHAG